MVVRCAKQSALSNLQNTVKTLYYQSSIPKLHVCARGGRIISRRAARTGSIYARVAELVDALASGASVRKDVEVQVLSRAP